MIDGSTRIKAFLNAPLPNGKSVEDTLMEITDLANGSNVALTAILYFQPSDESRGHGDMAFSGNVEPNQLVTLFQLATHVAKTHVPDVITDAEHNVIGGKQMPPSQGNA